MLTETSARGDGFLADVVAGWEDATAPAARAGLRTVQVRTGLVQTPRGGMLHLLYPLFAAGLGGRLGSGKQWLAWIGLDDLLDIYLRAVLDPALSGPVNAVAPAPVRNADYTAVLAGLLHRPALVPVPPLGPRLLLGGEGAREIAEASQYVRPQRLINAGHHFRYPELEAALRHVLGREPAVRPGNPDPGRPRIRASASGGSSRVTGRSIAVIGGGISGLTAGYVLSRTDQVTLFEADPRLGGHADTHLVGPVPVDTGFIVYNERTYPLLTRLFAELGVSTRATEMSMSVRCAGCGLHYAGKRGPGGLAPGLRRGGGRFLRLLADVPRFHRAARALLTGDADGGAPGDLTFGEFLAAGGYSGYFQAHFALPLVAAVWSCPAGAALSYPARYLFAFLANHGMLSVSGSPPWRTVAGGSRCYVERAAQRLACVRLGAPVRAVRRYPDGAEVRDAAGQAHQFDAVVIATHPDQALALLAPATAAEREVLGAFRYTPNPALLHTDARLLPDRPGVRASWNYELGHCRANPRGGADQLRHEPAAGPARRPGLHRDPERPGRRRPGPGHQPDGLRASGLHAGVGRRPAPPARAEHAGHRVRRRLPRLGLPRGRLPVRRPGGRARSGGPGDGRPAPAGPGRRAVRVPDHPHPAGAAAQRVHLPHLPVAGRPGPPAPARPRAAAAGRLPRPRPPGRPPVSRSGPTSTASWPATASTWPAAGC